MISHKVQPVSHPLPFKGELGGVREHHSRDNKEQLTWGSDTKVVINHHELKGYGGGALGLTPARVRLGKFTPRHPPAIRRISLN